MRPPTLLSCCLLFSSLLASSIDDTSADKLPHHLQKLPDYGSRFRPLSFHDAYSVIWGDLAIAHDGSTVDLKLDQDSGSGFVSQENYLYGFFSASVKLPPEHTAGIVLAFYASNGGEFPRAHDELDFELLGGAKGQPWLMQTNIYGNGSVSRGREERFRFWFDPTAHFHNYSILWNHNHIVFMVDNIPIREMKRSKDLGGDYPSKPMAVYATMWDGSSWATNGGKDRVNYTFAPFVTRFMNMKVEGCAVNPLLFLNEEKDTLDTRPKEGSLTNVLYQCKDAGINSVQTSDLLSLTSHQKAALKWVRKHYLYYSYCADKARYANPLHECNSDDNGHPKVPTKTFTHPKRDYMITSHEAN